MDSSSANALDAIPDPAFSGMSFAQVCALASRLQSEVRHAQALNAKMAHEMAVLKRLKFAASAERFSPEQKSLLQEVIDEDLQALEREVGKLQSPAKAAGRSRPRSARRCRPTCRATTSTTNPTTPSAPHRAAAAR